MRKLDFPFCLSFTLIITMVLSCKNDEPAISDKKGLIPLKTGNYWTYKVYTSEVLDDTSSSTIGNYVSMNGYHGFLIDQGNDPFPVTFLIDNDDVGNYMIVGVYSDHDTLMSPSVMYKKNAVEGESWDFKEIYYDEGGYFFSTDIEMYCVKTDTIINTSAGDFNCFVYRYSPNSGDDVFFEYVSDGIGIVKWEHFEGNDLFKSMILMDYRADY
jgi:hypothetical protein